MAVAIAIFAMTYVAVAAGRLPPLSVDRPAAALLGAVLMEAARVLSPAQASAAVNGDTLGLLLGTMILSAYLDEAGFFRWASFRALRSVAGPRTLLWALVFTAGVLSAFLVNDTVCLAGIAARMHDAIGSAANVIVLEIAGSRARIGFWAFLRIGAAVTAATLAAGLALLLAERELGWI